MIFLCNKIWKKLNKIIFRQNVSNTRVESLGRPLCFLIKTCIENSAMSVFFKQQYISKFR